MNSDWVPEACSYWIKLSIDKNRPDLKQILTGTRNMYIYPTS